MDIMTHDQIKSIAPAVFTTGYAEHLTDQYNFINTGEVLKSLEARGFFPVQAQQDNARERDPRYVRHSIVLRPEAYDVAEGEVVPQVLLVNSHNGRTKLRLFAGFYRFVCANGLVVGDDRFTAVVPHHKHISNALSSYLDVFADNVGDLHHNMKSWSAMELNKQRMYEYAKRAMELRFGIERAKAYELDSVLEAQRTEDEGRTLWQVYNTVQERTFKGGIVGKNAAGHQITSRPLTGIGSDLDYNRQLWALTKEVAEAA